MASRGAHHYARRSSMKHTPSARHAAGRAIASWNIAGEPELLTRLENVTYQTGPSGHERIIRVTEVSHRSRTELESELDWVRYLSQRGVRVAVPLPSADGKLVETFDTEDGAFHVSVFTKAPGRPMRFSLDWQAEHQRALGELIGSMHAATMSYGPSRGIQRRKSWLDDMSDFGQYIPKRETIARREFAEVVEWASSLETRPDNFGLVHADLNYGNYLIEDKGGITAFDFDDCHYNWFACDLAVPMFYALISFDLPSLDVTKQDWFYGPLLGGYTQHMEISDQWLERVPGFVRLRRVDLFAFMCKEFDIYNLTSEWDIKALRRIREGFLAREPLV